MTNFDHKKYTRNETLIKLLFLWPSLAILLFLIAYPFVMLIYYSFFNFFERKDALCIVQTFGSGKRR